MIYSAEIAYAFVSPNVLQVLADSYGIAPITTPEEDINKTEKPVIPNRFADRF